LASSNNATPAAEETAAFTDRWTHGQVLAGKYVVENVVGAGAMAIVVSAMHRQLDTRVAIKFLRPEMLGKADLVSRFRREGRAAAKIRSKHVARVFDVGELDDGTPFMVMEYLEGNDLAQVLEERGPLPVGETIGYGLQVCEALAGAHALGIVHRDIKPANIFLQSDGDSGCVKLLDFGISKAVPGAAGLGDLSLTQTVSLMGSPLYMSPEQLRETRVADARSDIWSLGVVIYELLTGEVAFNAESITKLTATILEGSPKPICAFRPDVPPELESVIHRCLAKDVTLRYQSVIELARDLMPYAPEESRLAAERSPLLRGVAGTSVPPTSGSPWSSRVPPPASGQVRRGEVELSLGASPPGGATLRGAAGSTLASASGPARSAVGSSLFPMGVAVEGGPGREAAQALAPSERAAPRGRFVAVGLVALAALGGGYRLWSPARQSVGVTVTQPAAPATPMAPSTGTAAFATTPPTPTPATIQSPHEPSAESKRPPPISVAKNGPRSGTARPAPASGGRQPPPKGSASGAEVDLGY
jgi:eukaryotic-like serine/threonine-protein kinase